MDLETLIAEREIQAQLVRLARAMDNRDWTALEAICTEDVRADFGTGEVSGRREVIDFIRSFLDNCGTTQHLLGNFLFDVTGDRATSQCYVCDMHLSARSDDETSFRTLGNYADEWIRAGDTWKLCRRVKDNRGIIGSMDVFKP
jgi:3-phenylpropionate/cinnamic acid dioxygenase small subunit